jgi:hypothetical protein
MKVTATNQEETSGLVFRVASFNQFLAGSEAGKGTEYVKIRIKNNSPSTKLTLGAGVTNYGGGALDRRLRATLDIEANSSEWKTYTFSVRDLNFDTTGTYYWATYIRELAIFPFGYSDQYTDQYEGIVGDQYYMEIDYVVIGSYEYVSSYQSALEEKENAATDFQFITRPTKTEYFLGETVDLSGFTASLKYGTDKDGNPLYADEVVDGNGVSAVYNFDKPLDKDGKPIVTPLER